MDRLLSKFGINDILLAIQIITTELHEKLDGLCNLYARISKTNNPNELLSSILTADLELIPGFEWVVSNPDNKYWYANLITIIESELFRISDLWEYMDGESSWYVGMDNNDSVAILDKLYGIHRPELLSAIEQKIILGRNQTCIELPGEIAHWKGSN